MELSETREIGIQVLFLGLGVLLGDLDVLLDLVNILGLSPCLAELSSQLYFETKRKQT